MKNAIKTFIFILSLMMLTANAFSFEVEYKGTKYTEEQWDAYNQQFDDETQYEMDAEATFIYTEKETLKLEKGKLIRKLDYLSACELSLFACELSDSCADVHEKLVEVQKKLVEVQKRLEEVETRLKELEEEK